MVKPSPAVFRSKHLDDFLKGLAPKNKFRKWVEGMEATLKENMFAGEQIRKRTIPSHYVERYGVNNLFRYAHPEGYRSCYTLINVDNVGVCPMVLDLLSHREYDRIFGYRTT